VSNGKCLEQSGPFSLGSISKAAVPIGERSSQFAPPEAQNAQLEFYGGELFGG
jgi:hypothetical protein